MLILLPRSEGLPLSTLTWCLSGERRGAGCGAHRETNTHVAGNQLLGKGVFFNDFGVFDVFESFILGYPYFWKHPANNRAIKADPYFFSYCKKKTAAFVGDWRDHTKRY